MPTRVLAFVTSDYPAISNRIKGSISKQSAPAAIIASQIDTTVGHPQKTWMFPGLPDDNYKVSIDEIDGGGAVVNNIAVFNVVPGTIDGLLCRDDEHVQVDVTPNFFSGLQAVTFDGSNGSPDYRGWEIVPSELTGRGVLVRDVLDYTWDKTLGILVMLQTGDIFLTNMFWNIHFNPIQNPVGNSAPTINDLQFNFIDVDTVLDDSYFGKILICEPIDNIIEVTLPDIATIAEGRVMHVQVSGDHQCCAHFIPDPTGSEHIVYPNYDDDFVCNIGESFDVFHFVHPDLGSQWRIKNAEGNFKTVGESVGDDNIQADVYNKQLLDGSDGDIETNYRIYKNLVLNLPVGQVVSYDAWATGNNKYLFSLSDSANPANDGKFKFPDRRNLFERNNSGAGKSGDFANWSMVDHQHETTEGALPLPGLFGRGVANRDRANYSGTIANGVTDLVSPMRLANGNVFTAANIAAEVKPINYLINKYVRL